MLNPFDWIRTRTAQAFIDGCADGLEALEGAGNVPPAALERLRQRLALPALSQQSPGLPASIEGSSNGEGTETANRGKRGVK